MFIDLPIYFFPGVEVSRDAPLSGFTLRCRLTPVLELAYLNYLSFAYLSWFLFKWLNDEYTVQIISSLSSKQIRGLH